MRKNKALYELISPVVTALDYELVDVEYHPNSKNAIVRVLIDKPNGVNLDDCVKVNEQVAGVLDVEDPITGKYTLEVSSPGIDRPLFTIKDFLRFKGENVNIRLSSPIDKKRNIKGIISEIEENEIIVSVNSEDYRINIDNIDSARLSPVFDKF